MCLTFLVLQIISVLIEQNPIQNFNFAHILITAYSPNFSHILTQ